MVEKLSDQQVNDLLTTLRSDAAVDHKVAAVTAAKSAIKQHNVPDTCVFPLFDALRAASTAQHVSIVNAGFSALGHLLTRLSRQEPKYISKEAGRTLPVIIEKMGDQKEKFRTLASQSMTAVWKVSPIDAERFIRNIAMAGKNPRAKESALRWLLQRHQEDSLQFRSYVPSLMELLEDADGMVRDAAKYTVIELFRNASNPAKADLKKQLKNFKVRPAIEQAIIKELVPSSTITERPESRAASSRAGSVPPARPNLSASVSSHASERPITPLVPDRPESVEPLYVNTQRELDEIIREMHTFFEGKETEQNWMKREESIVKLRRLIAGNASTDFPDQFIAHLRSLLDGIIKAVNSLRTSLSKEGCSLVQEIAITFGPAMDPMVELFMQTFIKLAASTKKISAQLANTTVDIIIARISYNTRIMQHIWGAVQDKNIQPRTFATGWLRTLLQKKASHKIQVEHGGGIDLVEKSISKGLADPNPGVREKMRGTFWIFHGIWPTRADVILNKLDSTAQKLLLKDPGNPNPPPKREPAGTARPGLGLSKSTMSTATKPSLRETMMAHKKAAIAAKKTPLPQRPGSAMSHFSPIRTNSAASTHSIASASTALSTAGSSTVRGLAHSGVSGAPVRPSRRRPEMAARPATAGPYSVRGHDGAVSQDATSPREPRPRTMTPKTLESSPRRTGGRRPGHVSQTSETSLPSPSKLSPQHSAPSPHITPRVRPVTMAPHILSGSLQKSEENSLEELTLVVPPVIQPISDAHLPSRQLAENVPSLAVKEPNEALFDAMVHSSAETAEPEEDASVSPARSTPKSLKVYEDPFTEDQTPPKLQSPGIYGPVLEDKSANENAATAGMPPTLGLSSEKAKQNAKLLDSGITRVKTKSLDIHGLRKFQGIIRDNKVILTDEKFDALVLGLFGYLEASIPHLSPEKSQDIRTQILSIIKLLLKKARENFKPHVSRGLEALLAARVEYDSHTHLVSGFEVLADELVTLGDTSDIIMSISQRLRNENMSTTGGCRSLSMGLHILKEAIDAKANFQPSEAELNELSDLAGRCFESAESGVRMDAVQLCVALHSKLGEPRFWDTLKNIKDDPKSLITYYIVKRQREKEVVVNAVR